MLLYVEIQLDIGEEIEEAITPPESDWVVEESEEI